MMMLCKERLFGLVPTVLLLGGFILLTNAESREQVSFYTVRDGSALAKVVTTNATTSECYFFGDRAVINYLIAELEITPQTISKKRFRHLRKDCNSLQKQVIRRRLRKERKRLRAFGRAQAKKNKEKNRERRKKKAEERGRRRREKKERKQEKKERKQEKKERKQEKKESRRNNRNNNDRTKRDVERRALIEGYELLYGIYPGTLWCGAGNLTGEVETEDGLGELKDVDACCRAHDHCPIGIPGLTTRYDLYNYSPITCSDCDCDREFMACLRAASSSDADTIGDLFFNVISVDCIDLMHPWKCAEYGWFGLTCSRYERDTTAEKVWEFMDPLDY